MRDFVLNNLIVCFRYKTLESGNSVSLDGGMKVFLVPARIKLFEELHGRRKN